MTGTPASVDGIVLLDKPGGETSNRALQRVKRLFGARKAGHAGSLDPLATGMLPICLGEATKIAGLLLGARKAYRAEGLLGVSTDSADADGEVVATQAVPAGLDAAAVEAAMARFRGRIRQVPPIYSALKQGGVPLYRRARRGEQVSAPPREVEIFRFELLELAGDRILVEVECGSGTYIRSLLADLGEALGCGAHVTALRRLWVSPFRGQTMHRIEELESFREDPQGLARCLLPLEAGLIGVPEVHLDAEGSRAVADGRRPGLPAPADPCVLRGADGRILALGGADAEGRLIVRRGFNLGS